MQDDPARVRGTERLEDGFVVGEHVEQRAREDDVEAVEGVLLVDVAADEPPRWPTRLRRRDDLLREVGSDVLEPTRRPAVEQLAVGPDAATDVEERRRLRQSLLAHEHVEEDTERAVRSHVVRVLELCVRQLEHLRRDVGAVPAVAVEGKTRGHPPDRIRLATSRERAALDATGDRAARPRGEPAHRHALHAGQFPRSRLAQRFQLAANRAEVRIPDEPPLQLRHAVVRRPRQRHWRDAGPEIAEHRCEPRR